MVNADQFALLILGSPVVKVELDESQLSAIKEYVELMVKTFGNCTDTNLYQLAVIDGILAYTKYVVGRIRSKYENLPSDKLPFPSDGPQLVYEAVDAIAQWKKSLENYPTKGIG